ncbi:MAG: sodium:solute symporter [Peptococcaceae bacterium]|jgi:SSS family solute:Na+ symporter|nr:sodium:solute symporter [Peptococcaceae bacterium]
MSLGTILWIITIIMCGIFLWISWRVKDDANASFTNYAIAGGTLPLFLVFFTDFATIMGVGNFIGHAGKGYTTGLPWLSFVLGEQGSKILFGIIFAGIAGRFTYITLAEMADDLFFRDKWTRALAALLATAVMIAWTGGQGKAFGNIFNVITGADPTLIIIMFSAAFIVYTALGGIYSVAWTDLLQGAMVLVFGVTFYVTAFAPVNWSFAELSSKLAAMGKANLWSFSGVNTMTMVTNFVTATVGVMSAQIYWQRCFAAKDYRTARRGIITSGTLSLIFVTFTVLVGMVVLTMKQGLKPDDVMPWFMNNYMPVWLSAMVFALILAAGMSSADSNLNSAVVLIVNDLIKPFRPDLDDKQLVKAATWLTYIVGAFACIVAIKAATIISLFSRAYAMTGSGLVPLIIIGLLWKERNEPHQMGKKNSKITPWGARVGIISGAVLSQVTALGPNRVLIALAASSALIIVVSMLTRNTTTSTPASVSK